MSSCPTVAAKSIRMVPSGQESTVPRPTSTLAGMRDGMRSAILLSLHRRTNLLQALHMAAGEFNKKLQVPPLSSTACVATGRAHRMRSIDASSAGAGPATFLHHEFLQPAILSATWNDNSMSSLWRTSPPTRLVPTASTGRHERRRQGPGYHTHHQGCAALSLGSCRQPVALPLSPSWIALGAKLSLRSP